MVEVDNAVVTSEAASGNRGSSWLLLELEL